VSEGEATAVPLLAVPNFSEGRDQAIVDRLAGALVAPPGVRLLDRHLDPDHNRTVLTAAGDPVALIDGLIAAAKVAAREIDAANPPGGPGVHPHVGALDVAPLVYLNEEDLGRACAAALVLGDRLGAEVGLPVFLYGSLGGGRSRAELRRGGVAGLGQRLACGQLKPDFGPDRLHPTAGATLVAARPPLVAFNCHLKEGVTLEQAKVVAAELREGGAAGLPGVRALAMALPRRGETILSFNVEQPLQLPLATLLEQVSKRVAVSSCEIVGLCPEAALSGFPEELLRDFDAGRQLLERALASAGDR